MAAAALTARIPLARATHADAPACGLAFHRTGGPVVAVCGLIGGAGTTTVAYLLARQAAIESTVPVLLTETTEDRPGLALVTGRATPRGFSHLASQLTDDASPVDTFAEIAPRLRMVASAPRSGTTSSPEAVIDVLAHARAAHGLVVIDCGTTWRADSPAVAGANSIAWTVPATPHGVRSAQTMLSSDVLPRAGARGEALIAVAPAEGGASVRALRRVARPRCERLILVPYAARGELDGDVADGRIAHALSGLTPLLRRAL